ncbi:MAG: RNA ligase (ATP) [Planctomycetota bacterium]
MERKLASIQRVLEIIPIENADAIELVRINGWQCVTKKRDFAVGDLGVFFEIDAIPPDTEPFRFLWQPKTKPGDSESGTTTPVVRPEKFRIRTLRLRGALSQGLFMPLGTFSLSDAKEGDDVTALLEVVKYEAPAPAGMGDFRASFPAFIPKTDEIRVQSIPQVLDELRGLPYIVTMKYDGTSSTFCIDPRDGEFHACGRNISIKEGSSFYWRVARQYDLERILRAQPQFAVQGEIVGPGIQKNPLGLKELTFFAFSVFDIQNARYLSHLEMRDYLSATGLPGVSIVEEGADFAHTQESLLALAEGKYPGTSNEREGIVIRSLHEVHSPALCGRLSFKAISNRYLLNERD